MSRARARKRGQRMGLQSTIQDGRPVLIDAFGQLDPFELDEFSAAVFNWLSRNLTTEQIQDRCRAIFDTDLSAEEIGEFEESLVEAGCFDSAAAREQQEAMLASFVSNDTLYLPSHGSRGDLKIAAMAALEEGAQQLAERWEAVPPDCRLQGLLCPHGSIHATGSVTAAGLALLTPHRWPDTFIILGTSHYNREPTLLDLNVQTPTGRVLYDDDLGRFLLRAFRPRLRVRSPEFLIEHSWKQPLELLQVLAERYQRPLKVVALLAGNLDGRQARRLAKKLKELLFDQRKQGCFIASGDLTHFGPDHAWRPEWLGEREQWPVSDLVARTRADEQPVLDAIAQRDQDSAEAGIAPTSFCARASTAALMEFVSAPGQVVAHETVLNWELLSGEATGTWGAQDTLFNAAAVAFPLAGPLRKRAGRQSVPPRIKLCSNILTQQHRKSLVVFHRCFNEALKLSEDGAPLLWEPLRGCTSVAHLRESLDSSWEEVDDETLGGFLQTLFEANLLHREALGLQLTPPPHLRDVAAGVVRGARATIPYYRRTLTSDDPLAAPFIGSGTVHRQWQDFQSASVTVSRDQVHIRGSSASTGGASLTSVVERDVNDERSTAQSYLKRPTSAFGLNRPSNLGLVEPRGGWPAFKERAATPGHNPTRIAAPVWDEIIAVLLERKPERLHGEGAYLAGLARRCLEHGVQLPELEEVDVGHTYCWRLYREVISRAFGVPIRLRYHSSEVGDMGFSCPEGHYHLAELHTLYEFVRQGRAAEEGELAALAFTTLDTRLRPLIRYANGDLGRLGARPCACGQPFRTFQWEGRIRNLLRVGRRFVTYRDIDDAIGAARGVAFFRLLVRPASATLQLVPTGPREIVDRALLRDSLADLLQRKVSFRWLDSLELSSPQGKLNSLATPDESERWYRYFFGRRWSG